MSAENRFEALVLPHLDAANKLANELTRNSDDAEDVVQDACVRAFKYINALHGKDAKGWFLMIVRHASYDRCKRNRTSEIDRDYTAAIEMTIDDAAIDPEEAALRDEAMRVLATALAELPLDFREVLILRELEELSYKDIARIADIPIGTVMSRLARARGLLQRSRFYSITKEVGPKTMNRCEAQTRVPAYPESQNDRIEATLDKTPARPDRLNCQVSRRARNAAALR